MFRGQEIEHVKHRPPGGQTEGTDGNQRNNKKHAYKMKNVERNTLRLTVLKSLRRFLTVNSMYHYSVLQC